MRRLPLPPPLPSSPGSSSLPDRARLIARATHKAWGVGDAACDTGVLLLLSVEDRKMRVVTGRGARARVSDQLAKRITGSLKPLLRRGDYDGAVRAAVARLGAAPLSPESRLW